MNIIIQAGGLGSRLESLTKNKPKCLVSIKNLPIIFHIFKHFPNANFTIISDYKIDVLEKYLSIFANEYNYKIIKAKKSGTISGIKEAISKINDSEKITIIWCDLILSDEFKFPNENNNYIGISKDFECRWSYINNDFIKEPSIENGIAGLFIFKNKKQLENIPEEGAFVPWLKEKKIKFKRINLNGTKEIGTLLSYSDNNVTSYCRPFNSIEFIDDKVIKRSINKQGDNIAKDEINWYKNIHQLGFEAIPEIYNFEPLTMKKIPGKNIFEYDCLDNVQKEDILKNIIDSLKKLHTLKPQIEANIDDCIENYINKTKNRLNKVIKLIPFSNKKIININGCDYKNILFNEEKYEKLIKEFLPKSFSIIHGDPTFSNIMFDTFNLKTVLIDPRGYFGKTKLYGDADYDWAKLYYSIKGNYDQFNRKKFNLNIQDSYVELKIKSNGWEDMEDFFFKNIPSINKTKIKLLHSLIWLSLTTYVWDDYDSICGAFYNGIIQAQEII